MGLRPGANLQDSLVRTLPLGLRRWVRKQQRRFHIHWPPLGKVDFGDLRRVKPVSSSFGMDRGQDISRYYIEKFLSDNAGDIKGRVLEFGDPAYTLKYGQACVIQSDVLSVVPGNPKATIVADLSKENSIPSNTFDCIICTQTLQMIFDVRHALRQMERILKPGGVILITTHGISQIGRFEGIDDWGEYWHFTSQSLRHLVHEFFPPAQAEIHGFGNVLAAVAHLHGLCSQDVTEEELDIRDPAYDVLIGARARKSN